jgi:hypothetical protein
MSEENSIQVSDEMFLISTTWINTLSRRCEEIEQDALDGKLSKQEAAFYIAMGQALDSNINLIELLFSLTEKKKPVSRPHLKLVVNNDRCTLN